MESKVKPNLLLVVVKYGLDVVWYMSFVLIIFAIVFLITKEDDPNAYFSINVKYRGELKQSYAPYHEAITYVAFEPTHGKLLMKGALPLYNMVLIFIFLLTMLALHFSFLFYMRKLFTGFLRHSPFCMDSVKRMRVLSYCLVILNLLLLVWERYFIYQVTNISSFSPHYSVSYPDDYMYIIIALVIYVIADIFKYGVQIQEENSKFV